MSAGVVASAATVVIVTVAPPFMVVTLSDAEVNVGASPFTEKMNAKTANATSKYLNFKSSPQI